MCPPPDPVDDHLTMRKRIPLLLLITSLLVLGGALLAWRHAASSPPRADLVVQDTGVRTSAPTSTTSTTSAPAPTSTTGPAAPFVVRAAAPPTRLVIGAIEVDAPVRPVGVEPDGAMQIPPATEVGWFAPGAHPTAPFGSAVLAAHVDYGGRRGAFFRLRELQVGETVTVVLGDGSRHDYRVTERAQVDKQDLPTQELFRRSGPPTLTLVTCGGAFDASAHHYRDNIVIRAVPV